LNMIKKRFASFLLLVCLLCSTFNYGFAESPDTYIEPSLSEYNTESPALYSAKSVSNLVLYTERDKNSERILFRKGKTKIDLLYVGVNWCIGRYKDKIGYIKRERIESPSPINPGTPPYGIFPSTWTAKIKSDCAVHKTMSLGSESFCTLNQGTPIAVWKIINNWAIVIYMRQYGYIPVQNLENFTPVANKVLNIKKNYILSAYSSFYKTDDTESNRGRMHNIQYAAEKLRMIIYPGQTFDYNKMIGPFSLANGYQKATVLYEGEAVQGSGGGVCQVSSTLYNALLPLNGITIIKRRAHGPSGASYLPHGVDAASGSKSLNLIFRNDYDFPIEIYGYSCGDGTLFISISSYNAP